MAPVELHPELWLQIVELLVRPLPRPNGRHPRSAVTQNELCALARVCKLLHNIATPLLYKNAVVDYLPSFVYGAGIDQPPATTGIQSKRELIGHLERLYLEYFPKNKVEATYAEIMGTGRASYASVGRDRSGQQDLCTKECHWIADGAEILVGMATNLLSVSTGVFLGSQTDVWEPFEREAKEAKNLQPGLDVQRATTAVATVLSRYSRLWTCQRAMYGPLSFSRLVFTGDKATSPPSRGPSIWCHQAHHTTLTGELPATPITLGGDTRWYCPCDTSSPLAIDDAIDTLTNGIACHVASRNMAVSQAYARAATRADRQELDAKDLALSVDIYLPQIFTTPFYTAVIAEDLAAIKEEMRRAGVPRSRYEKDEWRFQGIEAPEGLECEACGWCVEDFDYE